MFIFDIFKREARRLRTVSVVMAGGMLALLAGLWFVQIVSGRQMQALLEKQSFHRVPVPAERGRIFDRNGEALVENRRQYNAVLYLEDLRSQFTNEYVSHVVKEYVRNHPGTNADKLPSRVTAPLRLEADYRVVSNITYGVAAALQQPVTLDRERFSYFYTNYPFIPLQILTNLTPRQVAIFSERLYGEPGLDLQPQPQLSYKHKTAAAGLLGYVVRVNGDRKYLAPDYEGRTGIEAAFDDEMRGEPGTNSIMVNNELYRQSQETLVARKAGSDVYLTIDLAIQQAAEEGLAGYAPSGGAAVVLDVRNGDVLAMASAPGFDPNDFVRGMPSDEYARLNDPKLHQLWNKAVQGKYEPGSTFKIITALACLESGVMDPNEIYESKGYSDEPGYRSLKDTAAAGPYNFERAFYRSSNAYFVHYGVRAGLRKLLEVARRFHLGEKTGFVTGEESGGDVPSPEQAGKVMKQSSTPDVSIGQEVTVTPLQMALMVAAIANGGTNFWPRVVTHIHSPDPEADDEVFVQGRVRDVVKINPHYLDLIHRAMLADTEHPTDADGLGGSGYDAFHRGQKPILPDFHVAAKTGTAQVKSPGDDYSITWFASYGPFENPRYAVVVMVLRGGSGGKTSGPVAERIYETIVKMEKSAQAKRVAALN